MRLVWDLLGHNLVWAGIVLFVGFYYARYGWKNGIFADQMEPSVTLIENGRLINRALAPSVSLGLLFRIWGARIVEKAANAASPQAAVLRFSSEDDQRRVAKIVTRLLSATTALEHLRRAARLRTIQVWFVVGLVHEKDSPEPPKAIDAVVVPEWLLDEMLANPSAFEDDKIIFEKDSQRVRLNTLRQIAQIWKTERFKIRAGGSSDLIRVELSFPA